jgi:tRNA nucleotidyltransferase (CCA-adding enzyme)
LRSPIDQHQIPSAVRQIMGILDRSGFETWLVGGCVRDLCLKLTPKDYDLATNALPEQVLSLFEKSFATGLKHGTVTVIWQDLAVEITTFRSESTYSDSRRPDLVVFHNQVEADLSRRDFTFNSMAWRADRGLLDLHGGLEDLLRGQLKCVGDPWIRFDEDALRLLRAIRFAVTYDLLPDPGLLKAAAGLSDRLARLSRERLTAEMLRILAAPFPGRLSDFSGCGLLAEAARILLETGADDRILCRRLQNLAHAGLAVEERLPLLLLAASAESMEPRDLCRALEPYFIGSARHDVKNLLMDKARVSCQCARTGEAMLYLVRLRLLLRAGERPGQISQRRILRLLARRCRLAAGEMAYIIAHADALLALCLRRRSGAGKPVFFADLPADKVPLVLADLAIDGNRLQSMGFRPGPPMRVLLEKLLSRVIVDPSANRPDILAEYAGRLAPCRRPIAGGK